jgi:hypothetical protein
VENVSLLLCSQSPNIEPYSYIETFVSIPKSFFFFIGIVGGRVQLGPLGTAAINRPTVPTPGDHDDGETSGMMIGRENRSTRRKPAPVPLCPP